MFRNTSLAFEVIVVVAISSAANAETVQTATNVFHGMPYLWVEAESAGSIVDGGTAGNGWKVVTKENPIQSSGAVPLPILPANTNASGSALLDDIGGGQQEDTAQYQVKFITAGTYQIYLRHSMYNADANTNYGNEDSIFMSPAFNKNSTSDWLGFQGLDFDETDLAVDPPTPGSSVDPDGWKPGTSDSSRDGWTAIRDWGVKSAGTVAFPNNTTGPEWNGHFNWYNRPFFVDTNPAGSFVSDYGFKTEYIVTPAMVGQTLTFEISNREHYGVFDGFLFINTGTPASIYPNMDLLDIYTQADLDTLLPQPVFGDYNGNGKVDAADYVLWRNGGPLSNEVDAPGTVNAADYTEWRARFGNPGSGVGAGTGVPEPSTVLLISLSLGWLPFMRRRTGSFS
jgi:hypothetical protein